MPVLFNALMSINRRFCGVVTTNSVIPIFLLMQTLLSSYSVIIITKIAVRWIDGFSTLHTVECIEMFSISVCFKCSTTIECLSELPNVLHYIPAYILCQVTNMFNRGLLMFTITS